MTTIGAGRTSPSAHRPVSRLRRLQAGRWSPAVLVARARQGREEAARRAAEAQMGEGFATLIATAESIDDVLPALAGQAAMALGATGGRIVRDAEGTVGGVRLELDGRRVGVLLLEEAPA